MHKKRMSIGKHKLTLEKEKIEVLIQHINYKLNKKNPDQKYNYFD